MGYSPWGCKESDMTERQNDSPGAAGRIGLGMGALGNHCLKLSVERNEKTPRDLT